MSSCDEAEEPKAVGWIPKTVAASVVTAIISSSLAYAAAEARNCTMVREDNIKLKADVAVLYQANHDANNRIDRIAGNLEKLIGQNTELIMLIRVQNQLKQPW